MYLVTHKKIPIRIKYNYIKDKESMKSREKYIDRIESTVLRTVQTPA